MTIAELINEIRLEMTDSQSTRWSDADLLRLIKKALRRLNHILKRNDISLGKTVDTFDTVAGTAAYDLPADFMTDVGVFRDDGLPLQKLTDAQFESAISGGECVAYILRDQIYLYSTPASVRTMTLVYWPLLDPSAYTTATAMPYDGKFDDAIAEYVALRCKNIEEMNISNDTELLSDFENQILATYGSLTPDIVRQRGWLP